MIKGHAKGADVKVVGSVEYGPFGGKVQGNAKGADVNFTPVSNLPDNRTKPDVQCGPTTGTSVDWTPRKGYETQNTPMSDRAVKQSQ